VVPDALSIAAMRVLGDRMGIRAGASTGTNLAAALAMVWRMRQAGQRGSVVTLVCDSAERYAETYYDEGWLDAQRIDPEPARLALQSFLDKGEFTGFERLIQFVEREDSEYHA
jgi:cysteine synthase A